MDQVPLDQVRVDPIAAPPDRTASPDRRAAGSAGGGKAMEPAMPVRRWHRSVAAHLTWFAAGLLIPMLAIVTWMLSETAQLRRDDSLRDATSVVRQLCATLELELERAAAVGETLATSRSLLDKDYTAFDDRARQVADRLGIAVVVRAPDGQQLVNTNVPLGTPLPVSNEPVRAIDRLAAQRRAPVVSDLVNGTLLHRPFVFVSIPVLRGPDTVAFVSIAITPRRIVQILSQGLRENWIAGVVGRDGRLIARSADQDRYLGTVNAPFLAAATRSEGTWTGATRDGDQVAGAYLRLPASGWLVSVAVPEAALRAPAREAMFWLAGLVAASLAMSVLLGWCLARRISWPIRDLVAQARGLGRGRQPREGLSSVDEVNEVTGALRAAWVELDRRAAESQQAAEAVRANEERLQLVQDTAGIGTVDWDLTAGNAVCSPRCLEILGLPAGSAASLAVFAARLHPDDRTRLMQARDRVFASGAPFEEEFRVVTPGGEQRWISVRGRLDTADGKPVRLLAAGIDITARKQSEEHLRFLLREISHRSKNLLAVIQAMAGQTAKSAETVDAFRLRFGERLMGMAASHDLLVNRNWLGAPVASLVRGQLASFVAEDDPRVVVHGPHVELKAEAVEALGLALHELATNSLKFGALSSDAGRLEIVWDVVPGEQPDAAPDRTPDGAPDGDGPKVENGAADGRGFRMDWIEHTPGVVSPPEHKGFGRMVIEHTVEATLRGRVTLSFPPEGVRWRIEAPATCLAPVRGD